jgi:sigma-B regulation protein RsbU (phosphoserine phosphatase)
MLKKTPKGSSLPEILSSINNSIIENTERFAGLFVTLFFGELKLGKNILTFSNAGHVPPLIFYPKNEVFKDLTAEGFPLGLFANTSYEIKEASLQGDELIFLYTDGLIEAKNPQGQNFGKGRLKNSIKKFLKGNIREITEGIISQIKSFSQKDTPSDDITVFGIKLKNKVRKSKNGRTANL